MRVTQIRRHLAYQLWKPTRTLGLLLPMYTSADGMAARHRRGWTGRRLISLFSAAPARTAW